ncbi:type II secretion protein K [Prodigiosinella confusarubida]|uniref:Type II secretion system protein K n=1 Tax=Serratia sp. (strain ATCC 39006) TaxID=104623 RepID=A0A2I5T6C1_SERS3|nr:type II secretion system minor pseudopilin GspK [Serratia sp. ATCC 39006]AUH00117.1 type II secretion protein K [Serratia sp. ATCC 39006]AUH04436.1 type II secretion protein K [Serratia sp. ATCC 39006]
MNSRQRGVALLVVMLILALMVTVAYSITERTGMAWQRTESQLNRMQAKWYARGAEALVESILLQDALASPKQTSLGQSWSRVMHQTLSDGGEIRSQVQDGLTCLNLNALNQHDNKNGNTEKTSDTLMSAPYAAKVLRQLIIGLGEDATRADNVVDAIRDWIDEDSQPRAKGAEDESYPAYHPANQNMVDVSELRVVSGMDTALYRRLLPYVCVLPVKTMMINVNTLRVEQAPLMSALFMGELNTEDAQAVLSQRPAKGWGSVNEFIRLQQLPDGSKAGAQKVLAIKSEWFFADVQVLVGDNDFYQRSLFHIDGKKIDVIQRQYGGYRTVNP